MAGYSEPRGRFVGYRMYGETHVGRSIRITNRNATINDLKFEFYASFGILPPGTYDLYRNNVLLHHDDLLRLILPTGGTLDAVMKLVITVKRRDEVVTLDVNDSWTIGQVKAKLRQEFNYPDDFELQHMEEDFDDSSTISRTSFGVSATSSTEFDLRNMGEDLDNHATLLSLGIKATSNKLIAIDNDVMDSD
ncbi:hypothetical protein ACFE04_020592 [Oxalis oulophora]